MFSGRKLHVLFIPLACCLAPICSVAGQGDDWAGLGPLFQEYRLTLDYGTRVEAFSPFYYQESRGEVGDETRAWAVPPLFSYTANEGTDYEWFDFLWRGMSYTRYGEEYRFQILQFFSFTGGGTQSETNINRFTLFPFYFQQRSKLPGENYTALFPFYGTLRKRLFRDEIKVVMFPIYGRSRKRDMVTDNYLYPFFHLRRGDQLKGWQFWPLVGRERKEVTEKTNGWGDIQLVGGHRKFFALWPIYFDHRTDLGTAESARQMTVLPFYSSYRSDSRRSTSYLAPFGVSYTDDRGEQYTEWGAPWPLIVFARGEGKTTRRVWPFYSRARTKTHTSNWYLWPIYKFNGLRSDPLDRGRTRILLFLYSAVSERSTETGKIRLRRDLWPLYTWNRDLEGKSRLQVFSPLEPYLPGNSSVERNLSPIWSVWRSEHNPDSGGASQSLLWNLYRWQRDETSKKCSLLFGLFQYQHDPGGRRWRLCYIPFGQRHSRNAAAPE